MFGFRLISLPISLIGASLVLSHFFPKVAMADDGTSIGVCGLSIPKEHKGFVITMYSRDKTCPTIPNNKTVYNKIIIENIHSELLMCGVLPPPGFVVMKYRKLPDCSLTGKYGETSEDFNAIYIEKGSPQKKGLAGPPPKGSLDPNERPSPKFDDIFSPSKSTQTQSSQSNHPVGNEIKDGIPGALRGLFR